MTTANSFAANLAKLRAIKQHAEDINKVIEIENRAIEKALHNPSKVMIGISNMFYPNLEETNEPIVPFPLTDFIRLYYAAAKKDVYIEYMKGAKLLYNWLAPLTPPDIPAPELANCEAVADKCGSYEMDMLAQIIHTTPGTILWILMN